MNILLYLRCSEQQYKIKYIKMKEKEDYEFLSPEWWEWWESDEHQREYQKQIDDGLYSDKYKNN